MKSVARGNRVVFGLIIVSLVGFSAYCWQLLSQQQRAFDLSVAAEMVLNRVNTDTVYLLGREKASDGSVQQRLSLLSSHLDRFVRLVHEDPESVDDPGSQALQRDIDGYLLDLARLYTMEMTIEYLAPRFQGQLKALQGTLPVGEAQYRDLTELMRLHHYLRRSWDQNEQRQLLQLQQHLLDRYGEQPRVTALVRLGQEFNQQVMEYHRLRNQVVEMKGLSSLPAWKQSKLERASSLKSRFYLMVLGGALAGPGQERLPGQHEPRDPHPHECHHRLQRPGTANQSGSPAAGLSQQDQILVGHLAAAHQRHSGSHQGGVRQVDLGGDRLRSQRAARLPRRHVRGSGGAQAHRGHHQQVSRRARLSARGSAAPRSGTGQPGEQCHQVHRAGRGGGGHHPRPSCSSPLPSWRRAIPANMAAPGLASTSPSAWWG